MKKVIPLVLVVALIALLLPACSAPLPSLPPVTDKGASYTDEKSGLTITFPEDWTLLSEQEILDLSAQTVAALKDQYRDPAAFEKALQQNVPVAYAFLHPVDYAGAFNANVNVIIMDVPSALTSNIVAFAKTAVVEMSKQMSGVRMDLGEVQPAKVGGLDAAVVDMSQTQLGLEMTQKQFYVARNGRLAIITLSAASDHAEELDTLQKAVDNIRFK